MWVPEYYQTLQVFIEKETANKLFFWLEDMTRLQVSTTGPPQFYREEGNASVTDYQIVYFLKRVWDKPITYDNIEESIRVGTVQGEPLIDTLNKMNTELPKLLAEKKWPDGVREEFVAQLHKFMGALTEASAASQGRTTLYIPQEDLANPKAAAKSKDLLQRLESTVIGWTRQIKEVTSNQDSHDGRESASPLDEIENWKKRTTNLSFLHK